MALELTASRAYPVEVAHAFDTVLPAPLPDLFPRRYAAMPAVREVRDAGVPWSAPGQSRTIVLADGGTLRETLTAVDRPRSFGYRLTDVTGPLRPLVSTVDGLWLFDPVGTGVRITWSWTIHPRGSLGAAAMPVFGRMWRGYARQALEEIERLLVGSPGGR